MRNLLLLFIIVMLGLHCKKAEDTTEPPPPHYTIPIVLTNAPTNVTDTGTDCSGAIKDKGGLPILSKGVCWSLSATPTVLDSVVYSTDPADSFTCTIKGLTPETVYHMRAFAKNDLGVGYGEDVVFTTTATPGTSEFHINAVGWRNMDVNCNGLDTGLPACQEHLPFSIALNGDTSSPVLYNGTAAAIFGPGHSGSLPGLVNFHTLSFSAKLDQAEPALNGSQHGTMSATYQGNHIYEGTYNRRIIVVSQSTGLEDSVILAESGHFSVEVQP